PARVGAAARPLPGLRRAPRRRRHRRRARAARRDRLVARPQAAQALRLRPSATGMTRAGTALALGVAVVFLGVPLVALFTQAPLGDVPSLLGRHVVRDAIWVTVKTNL